MKSDRSPSTAENGRLGPRRASFRRLRAAGFTLVEVLAALLMMAIVIPVAMEGMSIASRAGVLGQRKATAMRIAERVLTELIIEGETNQTSSSGVTADGDTSYSWSMRTEPWAEDAMLELTVVVTFTVQGSEFNVSASTLVPSAAAAAEAPALTP